MKDPLEKAFNASLEHAERCKRFEDADRRFFRFYHTALATHGKDRTNWPKKLQDQLIKLSDELDYALHDISGQTGTAKPRPKAKKK